MILQDGRTQTSAGGSVGGRPRLERPAWFIFGGIVLAPTIQCLLLFAAAGRFNLTRLWLFTALTFVCMAADTILVAIANPDLLNQRARWRKQRGTKSWDRALLAMIGIFGFYAPPIVIGLDVGRYEWSHLGSWAVVLGTPAFALGWVAVTWAMVVNPHFEVTVRIQTDRGHKVVATGPYAIVRHPGYLGAALWAVGMPLVAGSLYGLIPAAAMIAVLVIRTRREDRTLQAELPGYADYARRVRHRLVPGVW